MIYDEMTWGEHLQQLASVLRPEMQEAFWEGYQHYLVQRLAQEKATSEENYFKLLEASGWTPPKLHQNYWKLFIASAAETWEAGMCIYPLEKYKESALKQQAYLDELTAMGVDLEEEAD